jgi:hypothetical protein
VLEFGDGFFGFVRLTRQGGHSSVGWREFLKNLIGPALAASVLISLAHAQGAPPPGDRDEIVKDDEAPEGGAAPREEDAGRLAMFARELRDKEGCAKAAPAFRVVAGMGEGQEAAQHELGECLLEIKGANDVETALFRQEGEFWLTRAAFAGYARAQRSLAMDMASPANPLHNPKGSLMWSLIYSKNPTSDLYGYAKLPATLVPGLQASLTETDLKEAEDFAKSFTPITLTKFEGPKRDDKKRTDGKREFGPPQGGRRRRPGLSADGSTG